MHLQWKRLRDTLWIVNLDRSRLLNIPPLPPVCIPADVLRLRDLLGPEPAYVVGGLLRDSIALWLFDESEPWQRIAGEDWDIATPHHPSEVMSRLRKAGIPAVPTGIDHGTVTAVFGERSYEITTFRHDVESVGGRHAVVRFAETLHEDLERRDFTVNALAADLSTGEIVDAFGGLEDLHARRIRTVGDAPTRFQEDYLRMLRAVRFAQKLNADITPDAWSAIRSLAYRIGLISVERIRDELMKMLTYSEPSRGFVLLHRCGLLAYILPELEAGFGCGQNRFHADDVAMHTLHVVDAVQSGYPQVRLMALLHDLGKVPNKQFLERKQDYVFYGHQFSGKKIAKRILRRLRFSNRESDAALTVVENHMYNLKPDLSTGAIKRFVRKLGRERVDEFLRMRMADRRGNRLNDESYEKGIFHFLRTLRSIERKADAMTLSDLAVNGHDLIDLGLSPGPVFSHILHHLLDRVLDDPSFNQREEMLDCARQVVAAYQAGGELPALTSADSAEDDEDATTDVH